MYGSRTSSAVWKSKFYGAFIDATPARWRGDAGSSPLDRAAHPTHWLISTQVVCITANGFENFSTCPRTINEVQAVMAGGTWPPPVDEAPDLGRRWARFADGALEDVSVPGIVLPKGARRGSFSPGGSPGTRRGSGSLIGRVRASSGSFSGREDY